jgi:transcriptional regulator with XRE-family HTH domain
MTQQELWPKAPLLSVRIAPMVDALASHGEAAALVLAARLEAGLSQHALAELAGTSGATIAAYELGTKEPRLSTLRRIVEAAGMELEWRCSPVADATDAGLTREDRRSLALHRAIAARLLADPATVIAKAHKNLRVTRRANTDGSADPWFDEWERRLAGPVAGVVEVLVSHDQEARDLRQVTPFAGVLTDDERQAIYAALPKV